MKHPWLAALLNLIPLPIGIGYLYLGRPLKALVVYVSAWLASMVVLFAIVIFYFLSGSYEYHGNYGGGWHWFLAAFLTPIVFIGYAVLDAWSIANKLNGEKTKQPDSRRGY